MRTKEQHNARVKLLREYNVQYSGPMETVCGVHKNEGIGYSPEDDCGIETDGRVTEKSIRFKDRLNGKGAFNELNFWKQVHYRW